MTIKQARGFMLLKILFGIFGVVGVFLAYVSTRESKFHYETSGVIDAPAEKIFPYISNLKKGELWSPYDTPEAKLKKTFTGTDGEVGSVMEFEGNSQSGSGKLELLKLVPNEMVDIKLTMTKPFYAENLIHYKLTPEGNGTRFTWSMEGDGGFMTKLMTVFMDCEKTLADQFKTGITNLTKVVEGAKMNLTEIPAVVTWPVTHYVYVEKIGPFQETARNAWATLHQSVPEISKQAKITGFSSFYKVQPQMIYRAGVVVDSEPKNLPPGLKYVKFEGGKYSRFTLKGSYEQLPEASGRVFKIVEETKLPVADNFFIENYVNDPKTTPESELVTEILIPTK